MNLQTDLHGPCMHFLTTYKVVFGQDTVIKWILFYSQDWSSEKRNNPILPTSLNPLMKYSTGVGHHDNSITESHTHQTSGPMDILITYSRHTTPMHYPTHNWTLPPHYQPTYLPTSRTTQIRRNTPTRTAFSSRMNTQILKKEDRNFNSLDINHVPISPRQHNSGALIGAGLMRPSIAPPSLHAVAVHKFKPITTQTVIEGQRLHPHSLNT